MSLSSRHQDRIPSPFLIRSVKNEMSILTEASNEKGEGVFDMKAVQDLRTFFSISVHYFGTDRAIAPQGKVYKLAHAIDKVKRHILLYGLRNIL